MFKFIYQIRIQSMLGQPEMYDPAFLAMHAASSSALTGGTPGARHSMFPFPAMFPAAYRASRWVSIVWVIINTIFMFYIDKL